MAKILVVDDERNVVRAFEEILATRGHEVIGVHGAEEAIRRLQDAGVELMILDIRLPGMSGLDALARIRKLRPTLPVIVMTGQGTTDTAIEATKRGAYDYLLKPFEPAEMLRTIAKADRSGPANEGPPRPGSRDGRAAGRRHRGPQSADAAALQGHRAGGPNRCDRSYSRRIGHRKGTGGPGHLSA